MVKVIKMILIIFIGIIAFMTVFKIGVEQLAFIPDGLPYIGNLDEAAAGVLLLKCLQYLGIDLVNLFNRNGE